VGGALASAGLEGVAVPTAYQECSREGRPGEVEGHKALGRNPRGATRQAPYSYAALH